MNDPLAELDLKHCELLVARAGDGDVQAWDTLVRRLWPCLLTLARRGRGSPDRSLDDRHDVAAAVIAKLGGREGRGLKQFGTSRQRHPDKTFADWIRIVTRNVVRDGLRQRLGPATAADMDASPSVKRLLNEFASSPALETLGFRPPVTLAQTARQLLEFASSHLPADQYGALARWIRGASFEDIAAELRVGEAVGRRLVRAAVATLRRRFVVDDKSA